MATELAHYSPDYGLGGRRSGTDTVTRNALPPSQQQRTNQKSLQRTGVKGRVRGAGTGTSSDTNGPSATGSNGKSGNEAVRRRISRACDQCNQLRTKCDGQKPCVHCVRLGLTCEYERARKKRGKVSRKDIAARQAAESAAAGDGESGSPTSLNGESSDDTRPGSNTSETKGLKRKRSSVGYGRSRQGPTSTAGGAEDRTLSGLLPLDGSDTSDGVHVAAVRDTQPHFSNPTHQRQASAVLSTPLPQNDHLPDHVVSGSMAAYSGIDGHLSDMRNSGSAATGQNIGHHPTLPVNVMLPGGTITGYGDHPYAIPSPSNQQGLNGQHFSFGSPLSASFLRQSPMAGSPGWMSLPSPSASLYPQPLAQSSNPNLRYPVLQPLLPHIVAIIPVGLACDLLDLYFSSASQASMQPQSPYVLGYIFRKSSFLRQDNPRTCSPALLASMLWIAAQTSESAFLTSPPSARGKICQKLLELTVGLLRPLIHTPADGVQPYGSNNIANGVALGGFGVALHGPVPEIEDGSSGATGALDDVATYIHLATVVSASEYKAASLRWWNAAWSLARELKLGRELPPNPILPNNNQQDSDPTVSRIDMGRPSDAANRDTPPGFTSEEEREERRRIWWLLYIVDRHLALCYNRPLILLDAECDGLLQPVNEASWESEESFLSDQESGSAFFRHQGPTFECTGYSLFGHFMPLMAILGEVVDLHQARNHPRFGLHFNGEEVVTEISQQLEVYERSLKIFEARNADRGPTGTAGAAEGTSPQSVNTDKTSGTTQQRISESALKARIVVAYGTHLMHTLHILLNGKWDPISLLDDNDLWISSPSFISATSHAVSAAEAINDILEYDPDLSFMPWFFGIYLLQGSFLLLLIADKLAAEASPAVVKACESIVRAHEACVVTLNTEYQRNFRKVMRSALAQVRGRRQEDFGEQQLRRREVLALYRWTGDGTGLAL